MSIYNDMFNRMDGIMRAFARKNTQWMEDLFFIVKLVWQKLSMYFAEVTPMTGMLLISARILNSFCKLRSCRKWDKGLDIYPEDETSYTAQYQEALLMYEENEYCAKLRRVPVIKPERIPSNTLFPSATASGSFQSSFDPCDLSSGDEDYLMPNNVAKTTPRWSDQAARVLTTTRLNLNSLPESSKNCWQVNPDLNDYHSDRTEISRTFWILDNTEWWCHRKKMHWNYTDLSNVAHDIFSIIQHGVGVEAGFSLGRDVIGWRQSQTTGRTFREEVDARLCTWANTRRLASNNPALDMMNTENNSEMKTEVEESKFHRIAKVHNFLEMWQGSQKQYAAQKESGAQGKQITAVGYISDTEEILKPSWPLFRYDGVAVFQL